MQAKNHQLPIGNLLLSSNKVASLGRVDVSHNASEYVLTFIN